MRRVLGVTFTGLGAFLIVLAVLSRFYLPGQVVKFPLNEYTITRLTGTHVNYLNAQLGVEATASQVRAVSTTQGDVSAGSSSVAVWNDIIGVFDITNNASPGQPISYSTERLAFNRRTGELVNCCGAEIGTKRPKMSGQGFVWPIGVQKRTYQVFDTTLLKPEPARYTGTATVDGRKTYVFVESVTAQKFGSITVPGSLVNLPQSTVTLPEVLTATNTYYVDPGVGSPIKEVEQQDQFLQDPTTGASALTLFHGTLTSTPQSISSAASTAKKYDTELLWLQTLVPLIGLILGLILVVVGILLVSFEPSDEFEYEDDLETEVASEA
ncbi:MAG TPA: DUF3068 domain-containing protein [Streptosporangiaceae bacterium]|jgi:hypothetical protein